MAANIQAYLETLQQPWGQIYYDILFEQLQEIKEKRVLDFGSGFGLVANHLTKDNQVLAVEPNEEMVALRVQDHPYQQIVGSLDQLASLEDASFDVILCHNVLEYVEDRKEILKVFTRLLACYLSSSTMRLDASCRPSSLKMILKRLLIS